jgi:hypothetical protein
MLEWIGRHWRDFHARRWQKQLPPEEFDQRLRESDDPYAAARALDRLLLRDLVRLGLRTRSELESSSKAAEFGLPAAAIGAWMESARRRRLITRRRDGANAVDGSLQEAEWEITAEGADVYWRSAWRARAVAAWKAMRVIAPIAAACLTVVHYVFGEDVLPNTGVLDRIHIEGSWGSTLGPLLGPLLGGVLAGVIGGCVFALVSAPFLRAGYKRHYVKNACRVLARDYDELACADRDEVAASLVPSD